MALFKNKYRTESNRLKKWDYSSKAIYFITLVTQNRECIFGTIKENKMILNDNGKIIETELLKSIQIRERWFFHNWVIMPNHIHLLIEIVSTDVTGTHNTETHNVETHCSASLQSASVRPVSSEPNSLSRKPNSISSFVGVFKSITTKKINSLLENNKLDSIWQSNYHDHIVQNYDSFDKIYYYIKNNPKNWDIDSINS
jgi:putative transposase